MDSTTPALWGMHLYWHTYGTWLPGDPRGWHRRGSSGACAPDEVIHARCRERMTHAPTILSLAQRQFVSESFRETCARRDWPLHAMVVLREHVHVVLHADMPPGDATAQLKRWATRTLRDARLIARDQPVWERSGGSRYLPSPGDVARAITYVFDDHHTQWL